MNGGNKVSRRTVLRGAGAAILLPMLDIMRPHRLCAAEPKQAEAAARMVCIYTPHGVRNSTWYPKTPRE